MAEHADLLSSLAVRLIYSFRAPYHLHLEIGAGEC